MPTNYRKPKLLTPTQQTALLANCTSKKYQVIILLMLDCGLRVTEAIRLQLKHVNFVASTPKASPTPQENYVLVESLKKGAKTTNIKSH